MRMTAVLERERGRERDGGFLNAGARSSRRCDDDDDDIKERVGK